MTLNLALDGSARGLVAGSMAAILLVLVDRGFEAVEIPVAVYVGICLAGALAGVVRGLVTSPRAAEVAAALDARLALKNRLGTAAAIEARAVPDSDFALLVLRDAEQAAQRINPRSASPLRLSHAWSAAGAMLAALAAAILYLPEFARAENAAPAASAEEAAALAQARAEAARTLDETLEELRQARATAAANDEDLAALDELAAQLKRDDLAQDDFVASRDAAAEQLDELSRRFASQAERDERMLEELNRRFEGVGNRESSGAAESEAGPGVGAESDAAADFADALARSDYARAADAIDDLAEQMDEMTPEERKAVADELRRMRAAIDEAAESAAAAEESREEALREQLREHGLDEDQIDNLAPRDEDENVDADEARESADAQANETNVDNEASEGETDVEQPERTPAESARPAPSGDQSDAPPPTPEEISRRLQEEGVAPEQAQRLTEEIARANEERHARDEADDVARDLAQSLEDLAEDVEQKTESNDAAPQEPDSQSDQPGREQRDPEQSEQNQQNQGQSERFGEQGEQQEEQEQDAGSDDSQSEDPGQEQQQQLEAERQACPNCKPGAPCDQHQGGGATEQGTARQAGREGSANQHSAQARENDAAEGAGAPEEQQQGTRGGSGADQSSPQTSQERVKQALEDLRERRERAGAARRHGDDARQAAREIAEQMTPEERARMEQWAREFAKEDSEPQPRPSGGDLTPGRGGDQLRQQAPLEEEFFTESQDVDLREEGDRQRTIAEWLADERPPEGDPGRTDQTALAPLVTDAQRAAERAVNEGAVPRRYHDLIQRYFGRLRETLDKAADDQ